MVPFGYLCHPITLLASQAFYCTPKSTGAHKETAEISTVTLSFGGFHEIFCVWSESSKNINCLGDRIELLSELGDPEGMATLGAINQSLILGGLWEGRG